MSAAPAKPTPESVRETGRRLSNWGRWGMDDQRGTVNLITPEHRIAASRLVRRGHAFSLAIPVGRDGPQDGHGGRFNPAHVMLRTGSGAESPGGMRSSDDMIMMPLQGSTQLDGLAHIFYDGQLYNGYPSDSITADGAGHDAIDQLASGIVSRGVLVDVARGKGLPWLPSGTPVTVNDLEETLARQGTDIGSGDVLVLRTGVWTKYLSDGSRDDFLRGGAGLAFECCEWLHSREIAAVCADNNAVEVQPDENPAVHAPAHMVLIRDMGMSLGEVFFLDELADDCAADGVWEFLFSLAPLPVTGGVGSPVNPLALK
jgi:kynurenine formamidase